MKAAQIKNYGGPDVFELTENAPKPSPKKGQVLVEVYAAGINPFDYKVRSGMLKDAMPLQFPAILGGDFAGVVSEVGDGVTGFKKGDEVYGSALVFNGGSGSFAQFTIAKAANTARKPTSVTFEQSAALPLVGSSAIQALEEHIKLGKGQKILIHGGAGGIGHVAVQLAKVIGAYVATTVSTNDVEFAKSLGANAVIDYKTQKFEEIVHNFDAVFDTVGGETLEKSFQVLRKGSVLVSMLGEPDAELAKRYGATVIGQMTGTNTKHLERLSKLVNDGKIKVAVDKVYPLEQIKEAFEYQENVHPRGKIVLKIK